MRVCGIVQPMWPHRKITTSMRSKEFDTKLYGTTNGESYHMYNNSHFTTNGCLAIVTHRSHIYSISASDQTENRLKKLIMIWRALHEYVNFVHALTGAHCLTESVAPPSFTSLRLPLHLPQTWRRPGVL